MDSDFRPANRPAESLQAKFDSLLQTPKPEQPSAPPPPPPPRPAVDIDLSENNLNLPDVPKPKKSWREKIHLRRPSNKKEWAALIFATIVILGLIGFGISHALSHKPPTKPVAVKAIVTAPIKPLTTPSDLTGLPVSPTVNQRPVTAVMIENSLDARPQSGLGQAGVVFEAVAEGGITRFMALYQDTQPTNLGPIRSARPYYVEWSMGFDAGYAHVGGSPDALADIKAWGVRDLDEFYNGSSYHRISTREAPHNVYTSIAELNQLEDSKGYTSSNYTSFPRKAAAPAKVPTVKTIDLTLSGPDYNVHYDYNPATNSYNRSEGGAPQIDANTNAQLSPNVVIAIVVPESQGALDSSGAYYSDYQAIGSGAVEVFQDGTETTGEWTKDSNTDQITFTASNNQPIKLDPGQTWITAVTSSSNIAASP